MRLKIARNTDFPIRTAAEQVYIAKKKVLFIKSLFVIKYFTLDLKFKNKCCYG